MPELKADPNFWAMPRLSSYFPFLPRWLPLSLYFKGEIYSGSLNLCIEGSNGAITAGFPWHVSISMPASSAKFILSCIMLVSVTVVLARFLLRGSREVQKLCSNPNNSSSYSSPFTSMLNEWFTGSGKYDKYVDWEWISQSDSAF